VHGLRPLDLVDGHLGEPDPAGLAGRDRLGHRAPGLLDRHLRVDPVQLVEVDVVGTQAAETAVDRLADVLGAAQWRRPAPWKSNATLLWLVPATPIAELPVLPKFHQGRAPAVTFVRPIDQTKRVVLRLWHVADVIDMIDPSQRRPLWQGTATLELARMEFGLVGTARTTDDTSTPLEAVENALRAARLNVVARAQAGTRVLLAW